MFKVLPTLLLLFILVSCNGVARFDTGTESNSGGSPSSVNITAGVFPNQILDGQQAQLRIKLNSAATTPQVFSWQIIDSQGSPADDYFVQTSGSATIPISQNSATVYLTSTPSSVPTGTETFKVRLSGMSFTTFEVGLVEVKATSENPTTIDTVSIVTVENNGYANIANQTSYDISGVCSYVGGNISVTVGTVNGNATCSGSNTWSIALNLTSLATQGNFTVQAVHSGPNVPGTADRQIIRDTIAPTVAISNPAASSVVSLSTQNSFTVSGSCTEGSTVIMAVTSSGGGGTVTGYASCSASAWSSVVNVSGLPDGTLTSNVSISDLAGNTAADSRAFIKNTIAPTLAITAPVVTDVAISTNYTNQSVTGTCNKSGATVTLTGDVSGTLTATCNGTNFSFTGLTVNGADGFKSIYATMTDAYGNTAMGSTIILKHITLPTATLSGAPGAVSNQEILNITVGGTLVSQYRYKLGDNTLDCTLAAGYSSAISVSTPITNNLGADGNKKICVVAVDTYGNNQAYATATAHSWVKDTSVPILNITSPVANSFVNAANVAAFTITGDCGIDGTNNVVLKGNITATTYANCTSGSYTSNVNFTTADQGPVFIIVEQTNPFNGNTAQASRIFTKDTVLPTIAFSAPAVNAYINKANRTAFTVSGTCNEYSATPNISITGGSSTVTVACSGTTWTADLAFADETNGTPTITATITDTAGNEGTSNRNFILDTINPTVAYTSPTSGSYINIANQGAFTLEGSCSDAGANRIVVREGVTVLATVNCGVGTPNWTASVNLTALTQGAKTLTVTHNDAAGNSQTANLALTKDTVAPAAAWVAPLANVCISAGTAGSFDVSGTCTNGDGNVVISSAQLGSSVNATCSGGEFSSTLNISTGGLANQQSFNIQIAQTDVAGNSASSNRAFKFINANPGITFGGWDDVYAVGKKTYLDGNAAEPGVVRIKWKEWPGSNVCIPNAVKVFRSDIAGNSLGGAEVSDGGGIPSETRDFEDEDLDALDFGKAWYYGLKVDIAGTTYDVATPSTIAELRVVAPPDNMALVHRWIANQEVCGLINKTTDPNNHYRCQYSGQGKTTVLGVDYHDLQWDMLVDRFELGCKVTSTCGAGSNELCVSSNFLSIETPSAGGGVAGAIGSVYYNNAGSGTPGQCWYKFGAAATNWRTLANASTTTTQLAEATTSEAHVGPLVYVGQERANTACQQQTLDLSAIDSYPDNSANAATAKRLLRQKEWRAAASWSLEQQYPTQYTSIHDWIGYLEGGTYRTGDANLRRRKCNTSNTRHDGLPAVTRQFLGGYEVHSLTFETGSKFSTIDCQSRYGIQDMVGNVWEWASDQLSCSTSLGDTCIGQTSTVDTNNGDMNGFKFDGVQGPGDRRYASDPTYTADDWLFDAAARNGTTYFNAVLGLPLMADDAGGSVSIPAFSSAGHFHGDRIWLSPTNGNAVRGVLLGGGWSNGASYGRWASNWSYSATSSNIVIGARCALPVK